MAHTETHGEIGPSLFAALIQVTNTLHVYRREFGRSVLLSSIVPKYIRGMSLVLTACRPLKVLGSVVGLHAVKMVHFVLAALRRFKECLGNESVNSLVSVFRPVSETDFVVAVATDSWSQYLAKVAATNVTDISDSTSAGHRVERLQSDNRLPDFSGEIGVACRGVEVGSRTERTEQDGAETYPVVDASDAQCHHHLSVVVSAFQYVAGRVKAVAATNPYPAQAADLVRGFKILNWQPLFFLFNHFDLRSSSRSSGLRQAVTENRFSGMTLAA